MRQSCHQGRVVLPRSALGLMAAMLLCGYSGLIVTDAAAQLRRPPADPEAGVMAVQPAPSSPPSHKLPQGTQRLGAFQANAQASHDLSAPSQMRMLNGRAAASTLPSQSLSLTPPSTQKSHYAVAASESLPVDAPSSAPLPRREPVLPSEPSPSSKPARIIQPAQAVLPAAQIPPAVIPASLPQAEEAPQPQRNGANARSFAAPEIAREDSRPKETSQTSASSPVKVPAVSRADANSATKKPEAGKLVPSASPASRLESDKTASPSTTQDMAARDASKPDAEKPAPARFDTSLSDPDRVVFVVDQDLRQFLIDFSRRFGLRSDVAQSVRGRLTKVKLPVDPTALLKELEKRFDLEWMIEGDLLKVTSRSDLATRILPLGPLTYEEVLRELKVVDIDTSRYPLRKLSDSNAIITTAPTGHIGRVAALIDALRAGKSLGPDLRIVKFGSSHKVQWD